MKKIVGIITCALLASCTTPQKKVIRGASPGIEYHNQNTAPSPWISVVPSDRALAVKQVDFEVLSRQLHYDMSFEPHKENFCDIRLVVLDYTILPPETVKGKMRPKRYFMAARFYKIGKRPPGPPDFEVTTSMRVDKAASQEAMRYMLRDIIEEVDVLGDNGLLTPGRKVMVNLD